MRANGLKNFKGEDAVFSKDGKIVNSQIEMSNVLGIPVVKLTTAEFEALKEKDDNIIYILTDENSNNSFDPVTTTNSILVTFDDDWGWNIGGVYVISEETKDKTGKERIWIKEEDTDSTKKRIYFSTHNNAWYIGYYDNLSNYGYSGWDTINDDPVSVDNWIIVSDFGSSWNESDTPPTLSWINN